MNKYLELQDKLCQAMEMFAENAVNKAGFDRTIQATIISCVDESIGRYKVQYQDSMFYAYAQNDENKYSSGTGVYVLIQNNDMARDKFIIGTVDKLGMDYLSITDESDRYEKIGTNCLNFPNEIQLCSYLKEDSYLMNTNSGYIQNNELLTYIKDAECLLIQMDIQTALDQIQRRKGDYGLEIELIFKNELNENANNIIRKYIVNINQMTGNPYLYIDKTPQLFAISIDNENFLGIKSIKAFSKDFPKEKDEMPKDIFFSNLAVYAANRLDESELNTSRLTIHSPLGLVFSDKVPKLNIEAIARTGNEVTTGMDYYWFVEDASVTSQSDDFLILGGQGWKCLNFYDIIETEDEEVKEWKPDINTKVFNIDNQLAKQVKYKCVAVKGEEILNKEFTLYNSLAQYKIELISDKGATFYNGVGSPILTCKVTKDDILFTDCSYVWTYIDKNNILTLMSNIDSKLTVDISSIDEFNIYQCSVYKNNFFIGSAEITLLNKKGTEGTYNLVIDNGTQTFVYNEDGVSPASSNIVNPITILPLSFTLFDNNGQQFDEETLSSLDFSWKVPAENTLLQVNGGELIDGYYYFKGSDYLQLNYKIASAYSVNKTNNQIELNLTYKNLKLKATTNFIFIKEGEIGTNGTGVVAAIQAIGLKDGEEPMMYRFASTTNKNYSNLQFNLFSNEDEGAWLSVSEEATDSNMTWSILRNKYRTSSDLTNLTYGVNSGFSQPQYYTSGYSANIIAVEAKYNNKKYFTTLPMITGIIDNNSYPYILYLKRGTGFKTVMYASDGTKPKYNTAEPFEVGLRKTDGTEIDISGSEYTFTWNIKGTDDGNNLIAYLTKINTELNKNQFKCRPSEKYDGRSVSIALECSAYRNGSIISKIYIPIYFYLNTYGYDELNDWNGNSIEIDEKGGYILTPQIGAGEKNTSNQFTGLLMGKMVNNEGEKIGLIGLKDGVQSIFLDAKTGGAYFGEAGAGQIRIIPGQDPVIEGGGYGKNNTKGLQINLSENNPGIKFGNGNFSVDKTGKLRATGVNLTGTITAEEGYIGTKESGFKINSRYIANGNITGVAVTNQSGVYIGTDGINISGGTPATTSYITKGSVNIGGKLTFGLNSNSQYELTVNGNVTTNLLKATGGTIGCWKLNSDRMYDATKTAGVNKSGKGMAFWAGGTDETGNKGLFRVSHSGRLDVEDIHIKHTLYFYDPNSKKDLSVVSANDIASQYWSREVCIGLVGTGTEIRFTKSVDDSYQHLPGSITIGSSRQTYVQIACADIELQASGYTPEVIGTILLNGNITTSKIWNGKNSTAKFYNNEFQVIQSNIDSNSPTGQEPFFSDLDSDKVICLGVRTDSRSPLLLSQCVYHRTYTNAANVYVSSKGVFGRHESSSIRYKNIERELNAQDIEKLYNIPTYLFTYKDEYIASDDERYHSLIPGFIVEDWEKIAPIAIDHVNGKPEMWNNNIVTPLMFEMIKYNNQQINDLKQQVKQLQAKLDNI